MGYLSDFITGRSINEDDRVVAMVIIPAVGGYPDAVAGAAKCPVYPAQKFNPLSLPMHGSLDEYGFFEPDADDLGLEILLAAVKAPEWASVSRAINSLDKPLEFPDPTYFDNENVVKLMPGLAAMHASTFESLVAEGTLSTDTGNEPQRAAAIVLDGMKRWDLDKDSEFFNVAYMQPPYVNPYTTREGKHIQVPLVSRVLSEMDGSHVMSRYLVDAIRKRHYRKDTHSDGSGLTATFTLLHDFHRAAYGLHWMQKYWTPSGYSRGDNLLSVAKLQIADVTASLQGVTERLNLGPDYREGVRDERLVNLADQLRDAIAVIEAELELQNAHPPRMR